MSGQQNSAADSFKGSPNDSREERSDQVESMEDNNNDRAAEEDAIDRVGDPHANGEQMEMEDSNHVDQELEEQLNEDAHIHENDDLPVEGNDHYKSTSYYKVTKL